MASTKRAKKRQKGLKLPSHNTNLFSLFLILLGAAILIWMSLSKANFSVSKNPASASINQAAAKPSKLYIPSLSKILYVSDGRVDGDRWEISETGVSYYTDSALPGKGNTVLYGHNKGDILGTLPQVGLGETIYVVLESGDFISYQVIETKVVKPSQVEILKGTQDATLTVYTCSGFLDTARFVVVAKRAV
jgi:LPXTG-site transpeptidase (sortase) family protein